MILIQVKEATSALNKVFEVSILAGVLFLLLLGLAWFAYRQDNRIFAIVENNTKTSQELSKVITDLSKSVHSMNSAAVKEINTYTKEIHTQTKIDMLETLGKFHEENKNRK